MNRKAQKRITKKVPNTPTVIGTKNQLSTNKFLGMQTNLQVHIASGRFKLEENNEG